MLIGWAYPEDSNAQIQSSDSNLNEEGTIIRSDLEHASKLSLRGWGIPLPIWPEHRKPPTFPEKFLFAQHPVELFFSAHGSNFKVHAHFNVRVGLLRSQGFTQDIVVAQAIARDFMYFIERTGYARPEQVLLAGIFSGFDRATALVGIEVTVSHATPASFVCHRTRLKPAFY